MSYRVGRVKGVYAHTSLLKSLTIELEDDLNIIPGQFLMVWLPGYEEIPLSPSYADQNIVRLTVKGVGETTKRLISLDTGDRIYVRGPYGRGFDLDKPGKYLLAGGGYGAAPIIYSAYKLSKLGNQAVYVEGAKSIKEQLFIDEARKLGLEAILVTEDGSSGIKGLITDYIKQIIGEFDILLGCGPEPMLIKLLNMCIESGVDCQLSFERVVKCGIGICGSCVLGDRGLLVCYDGPVFNKERLMDLSFKEVV